MTPRWPCILVTMLCCWLILTTSASAECAWVLWTTIVDRPTTMKLVETIMPSDGYTTKRDCDRSVEQREVREVERRKSDPTSERFFVCFPDTVDPRGPKGK